MRAATEFVRLLEVSGSVTAKRQRIRSYLGPTVEFNPIT